MNRVSDVVLSAGTAAVPSVCNAFPEADSTAAAAAYSKSLTVYPSYPYAQSSMELSGGSSSKFSHPTISIGPTMARQGTKTIIPPALGSRSTAVGPGFQFNSNFAVDESNARSWRSSASFPAGTAGGATATVLAAMSPSNSATPFTAAFASNTAAAARAVSIITGPGSDTTATDRSQVVTACMEPSASLTAALTSALSVPTTSLPASAILASPVTSPSPSFRTRNKLPESSDPTGAGGGRRDGERTHTSAKATFLTASPAATDAVSKHHIQRLLHEIDTVCSSGVNGTISPVESSSNIIFEYDGDRDVDDGLSCNRRRTALSAPLPPPSPSAQGTRLNEQELQALLSMLPVSSEAAARFQSTPQEENFVVSITTKSSDDGDASKSALMLSNLQTHSAMVGDDAAVGAVAAEAVLVEPRELPAATMGQGNELANGNNGIAKLYVDSDGRAACSSNTIEATSSGTEAEVKTKQPSEEFFVGQTLRTLGTYPCLGCERHSAVIDIVASSRTTPVAIKGVNSSRGGRGREGEATEASRGNGSGEVSQARATSGASSAIHVFDDSLDAGLKVLGSSSSGYGSGSLSDTAERERSLRQLANRGSVDRGRDRLVASSNNFSNDAAVTTVSLANLLSPSSPPPPIASRATTVLRAESKPSKDPLSSAHRHNAWAISDGASGLSEETNVGKGGSGGCHAGSPAKAVMLRRGERKNSVEGSEDDDPAGFLDLAVGHAPMRSEGHRRLVASKSTHTNPGVVGSSHGADCKLFELRQPGQDQEQDHERKPGGMRNLLACRSQHWPPLQPKPPSRPRRASSQSSSAPPPPPPPPLTYTAGDSNEVASSSSSSGARLDTESSSSPGAEELSLQRCRRGVPSSSPLQARLFFGPGRSNRSLSESSAVLHEISVPGSKSAKASVSLSPPYGGHGNSKRDEWDDNNSESSESDFMVRHGGLTGPGGSSHKAVLATPTADATTAKGMSAHKAAGAGADADATTGSSATAALQAAAELVALIHEDLGRNTPAMPASSKPQIHQGSMGPLSPPSEAIFQNLPSPPLTMYPYPPPMSPSRRHLQQSPSLSATAAAAVTAANEVTAALQRTLCGRSQRRRSTPPQHSLKHSAVGSRLETLDEEGHLKPLSAPLVQAAEGDSCSTPSGGGSGGGDGLGISASGTSCTERGGHRRCARDSKRRSTSSTPRHVHRRHRLTGEPGESSSDGASSSNSSDEEYLQSLFRPLRM